MEPERLNTHFVLRGDVMNRGEDVFLRMGINKNKERV